MLELNFLRKHLTLPNFMANHRVAVPLKTTKSQDITDVIRIHPLGAMVVLRYSISVWAKVDRAKSPKYCATKSASQLEVQEDRRVFEIF